MELLLRFNKNEINVKDNQEELLNKMYPEDEQLRNNELKRIENIKFVLHPDDIEKYVVTNQCNTTYENNQEEEEIDRPASV